MAQNKQEALQSQLRLYELTKFAEHVLGFFVEFVSLLAAVVLHLLHLAFGRTPSSCTSRCRQLYDSSSAAL